jgi:hypothetical protein
MLRCSSGRTMTFTCARFHLSPPLVPSWGRRPSHWLTGVSGQPVSRDTASASSETPTAIRRRPRADSSPGRASGSPGQTAASRSARQQSPQQPPPHRGEEQRGEAPNEQASARVDVLALALEYTALGAREQVQGLELAAGEINTAAHGEDLELVGAQLELTDNERPVFRRRESTLSTKRGAPQQTSASVLRTLATE